MIEIWHWPGLSLSMPNAIVFYLFAASASIAYLICYFVVNSIIPALVISASLFAYFAIVFFAQLFGLLYSVHSTQKLKKVSIGGRIAEAKRYLLEVRISRAAFLLGFAFIQNGFFVAALSEFEPSYYSGTGLDRWTMLCRSVFQGFDILALIGYSPTRPIATLSLFIFFLATTQIYVISVVIFVFALTHAPDSTKFLRKLYYESVFATGGAVGTIVLYMRFFLCAALIGIGFVNAAWLDWPLFGACAAFALHFCVMFFVYVYYSIADEEDFHSIYVFFFCLS